LSAALTEAGLYLEAIDAIRRAEEIITTEDSSEASRMLLVRLSDRLARCLYQATQNHLLNAQFLSENKMLILRLRSIGKPSGASSSWNRYDRFYFDPLPIRKSAM
jgi:hypothetical protein